MTRNHLKSVQALIRAGAVCIILCSGILPSVYAEHSILQKTGPASLKDTTDLLPLQVGWMSDALVDTLIQDGMTAGWQDGSFFLRSADEEYRMSIGGRIQSRYEYLDRPDEENLSSFFMRRVRLDVRGEFLDSRLTWRIMPELARTANLREGWINYEMAPWLNIRFGQFVVPFQWLRFVSGNRQHFAERGEASEGLFGAPGGYDLGAGLHGRNQENTFAYGIALFDGSGRNRLESNSSGHMLSSRVTWSVLGTLPHEESDLRFSEEVNVNVGTGLQAANKNEVRRWDLGRSPTDNHRADWVSLTTDIVFQWRGLSAVPTGYYRRVAPDDPQVDSYSGWGTVFSVGYFVIPERVELVSRYSNIIADREDDATQQTDWGAGINVYHLNHNLKTQINFESLNHGLHDTSRVFRVQLHMQF